MNDTELYFHHCKNYWQLQGDSPSVAVAKALWWDCAEVWNVTKGWDEEKIEFFRKWRASYKPYEDVPAYGLVKKGAC